MPPGVGYSARLLPGFAVRTSVIKNLPTEYASTTNKSIRHQENLATKHRDRGPRQFTTDCRSAVRRSSRDGDHCRKARYLRGVEIRMDGLSCLDDC
jgi:hypothetical protein